MKIGNIIIMKVPKDNHLYGLALEYEAFKEMLKKKYKIEEKDLKQLSSICSGFRKVGRREPQK